MIVAEKGPASLVMYMLERGADLLITDKVSFSFSFYVVNRPSPHIF